MQGSLTGNGREEKTRLRRDLSLAQRMGAAPPPARHVGKNRTARRSFGRFASAAGDGRQYETRDPTEYDISDDCSLRSSPNIIPAHLSSSSKPETTGKRTPANCWGCWRSTLQNASLLCMTCQSCISRPSDTSRPYSYFVIRTSYLHIRFNKRKTRGLAGCRGWPGFVGLGPRKRQSNRTRHTTYE